MPQRKMLLAAAALCASAAFTAAASADPLESGEQVIQSGEASWYGPGLHGRRTASGEVFNTNELTAAHRSLPFGTRVKVTNHRTGRSTIVRINDRGPYARGRIIDLSRASAEAIGLAGVGAVSLARL
jgi:rare lipoprotein A